MTTLADLIAQQGSIANQYGGVAGTPGAPNLVNILSFLHGGVSDQQQLDQAAQNNPLIGAMRDAGAVGFDQNGRWNVNWDQINSMLPRDPYGQTAQQASPVEWEQPGAAGSHISMGAHGPQINASSYGPDAIVRLHNPNAVAQSAYGWTTPAGNFHVYPRVGGFENFLTNALPMLIAGGLGAGFGALAFPGLPAGMGQLFNAGMGNLESGHFNPMSFLPGIGAAAGLPGWPIGAGTTLARLFARQGGG